MRKRNFAGAVALCLMMTVLVTGLFQIFRVRLVTGGLYPAWSSLRSDADGTRVLFDSLAGTGRIETMRGYKGIKSSPGHGATVLFAGYSPASLVHASDTELEDFENAAAAGNRIVIAIDPSQWASPPNQEPASPLARRWCVILRRMRDGNSIRLFFRSAEGWSQDLAVNNRALVIERPFGAGSIVLSASSDAFSNKTLAGKRNSALLMQMIGPAARVVFDESHLGVQDTGSVLGLVHKYRLDGLLWGLLALVLVFVWSRASGFPPPEPAAPTKTTAHDSYGGLAQLLRRQLPASAVVEACVSEWERSNVRTKLRRSAQHKDPVAAYRALQEELTRK